MRHGCKALEHLTIWFIGLGRGCGRRNASPHLLVFWYIYSDYHLCGATLHKGASSCATLRRSLSSWATLQKSTVSCASFWQGCASCAKFFITVSLEQWVVLLFDRAPRVALFFVWSILIVLIFQRKLRYSSLCMLSSACSQKAPWAVLIFVRGVDMTVWKILGYEKNFIFLHFWSWK